MKYGLYVKIFKDKEGKKDVEMIYTENFEWVKRRDKSKKLLKLLEFGVQFSLLLVSLDIIFLCLMAVNYDIYFLKECTLFLCLWTILFTIFFNGINLIKYQKAKKWQKEFEETYEFIVQMAQLIEKRERRKNNDIRRRIK